MSVRAVRTFANALEATAAAATLLRLLAASSGRPPVVVFDIDDTLLLEDEAGVVTANAPLLALLHWVVEALDARVYLVTAREASTEASSETEAELARAHVPLHLCAGLLLAPAASRASMASVSAWKASTRARLAEAEAQDVALSVGDQWGDFLPLCKDKDIDALDAAVPSPYALVALGAAPTQFGLKLLARD